jgi:hypothetical protein
MEWLRKNDVKPVYLDEPTTMALANAAGLPMPLGRVSPTDKKKKAEDALDWLRNNPNPKPEDVDDANVRALSTLAGKSLPDDKTN